MERRFGHLGNGWTNVYRICWHMGFCENTFLWHIENGWKYVFGILNIRVVFWHLGNYRKYVSGILEIDGNTCLVYWKWVDKGVLHFLAYGKLGKHVFVAY